MTGSTPPKQDFYTPDLTEEDIYEAMKQMSGFLDITPRDFKEVYQSAFRLAVERLSREVLAESIMTWQVVSVGPDTPVPQVAEVMGRANVSGVPVVDDQSRVLGVISERDFLKRMGAGGGNFMSLVAACLKTKGCVALPIKQQTAAELMSAPAMTIRADTPVKEIAALFEAHNINRAPVTDEAGRLLGIVSRGDLVRAARVRGGE